MPEADSRGLAAHYVTVMGLLCNGHWGPLDSLSVVLPNLVQMSHLVILVTLIIVYFARQVGFWAGINIALYSSYYVETFIRKHALHMFNITGEKPGF